jgi:hypothetical protein
MWAGGLRDHNRTTPVRWPLVVGRYSVASTCCPLTMDSYSVGWPDNPALRCACTQRGETTGRDNLHTVEDIICYTWQVAPGYARIDHPEATCRAMGHIVLAVALRY